LVVAIGVLVALAVIGWTVAPVDPPPVAPRAAPAVDEPDTSLLPTRPGLTTNADDNE